MITMMLTMDFWTMTEPGMTIKSGRQKNVKKISSSSVDLLSPMRMFMCKENKTTPSGRGLGEKTHLRQGRR